MYSIISVKWFRFLASSWTVLVCLHLCVSSWIVSVLSWSQSPPKSLCVCAHPHELSWIVPVILPLKYRIELSLNFYEVSHLQCLFCVCVHPHVLSWVVTVLLWSLSPSKLCFVFASMLPAFIHILRGERRVWGAADTDGDPEHHQPGQQYVWGLWISRWWACLRHFRCSQHNCLTQWQYLLNMLISVFFQCRFLDIAIGQFLFFSPRSSKT